MCSVQRAAALCAPKRFRDMLVETGRCVERAADVGMRLFLNPGAPGQNQQAVEKVFRAACSKGWGGHAAALSGAIKPCVLQPQYG